MFWEPVCEPVQKPVWSGKQYQCIGLRASIEWSENQYRMVWNQATSLRVVTPISAVLRAATGDCDPVYGGCRCGLPYYNYTILRILPKSHESRWILRQSQGHRQFSSAVTWSQAVFGWSQTVTLVAALSTAHIGVTTPWAMV